MRTRLPLIVALSVAVVALAAAPAAAAVHGPVLPTAVLGIDFPSVKNIVSDVVKFFFSTFLDALVPDWLTDGSVKVIKRLVTIPNPTDPRVWPTLGRLSEGMRWIALPLLSLAVVASWVQQWLREMTGRPGSLAVVLPRTVLAVLLLVVYPTLIENAVALVNSITNAMLSLPAVQHGLERTVGLVFARTLLSGNGVLLALLGIAAVLLAVGLFMLSVGLLTVFAIAFVSAPFAIACSVLDETRGIWTAWRYTLLTAALIPVGWCVLFASAGAFMVDMTTWSGGVGGTIGARFVGVFAALLILVLAVKWPLMLWGTIRAQLGGALLSVGRSAGTGSGGASGGAGTGGRAARAALQRTSLRAGDAVSGALGTTRTRAATSARMALSDGARVLARMPGAGAVAAAGSGAVGAVAAAVRPVAAAAARVARPALRGGEQARARGRAAAGAARAAYAVGSSTGQAASAGLSALSRPTGPDPSRRPASAETSRRGGARPARPSGAPQPPAGERRAATVRPQAAASRAAANPTPSPRRTSSTAGRASIQSVGQPTGRRATSRLPATPRQPTPPRLTPPTPRTPKPSVPPIPPAALPRRPPIAPTPPPKPKGEPRSGRPSGRPPSKER